MAEPKPHSDDVAHAVALSTAARNAAVRAAQSGDDPDAYAAARAAAADAAGAWRAAESRLRKSANKSLDTDQDA